MDNKFQPQYDDGSQFMLQPEHDASVKPRPVYMFRPDGTPTDLMSSVLVGDYGQRRGYTPARDEGVLKEFGKGLVRGTAEFGQGVAKTFDATEQAAGIEFFLSTNRQLADSESKGVWSYIANVAGAQIAQNAPMMLATLGAGAAVGAAGKGAMAAAKTAAAGMSLQEGGALVAKTAAGIAAKKLVAAKAAGMASTFIMENGGDLQELRERLPDVPDEQRVAMAFGLSLFKAWVEVGWGVSADTAKAISRWGLGRALAQGGTLTGLQKLVVPRWMGSIGGSVIGKWARTGAEETFEELIQKSGTEALVALNRGASYDKGAGELFREYSQVLREGLIGGLALGVLPTTMNAITEAQIRQKRNRITGNSDAARESLDSGQPIDGVRRYDQAKVSKTNQVFADLYAALGHKFEEDPGKRTRPVDTLVHLCYNIANEAATQEADPSKRDAIRPENYIKDLSVLLMSNTDEGRAAAAVLNDALDKAERSENGGQIILDAISQVHKDTGIGIVSVMETAQLRRLEAEQDTVRRETMKQVLGDENAELDELRKLADEAGASIRSKYGTQPELRVAGTKVVNESRMSEMLASLGDKARAVYAFGWITGIKIGDSTKAIKITRNRATGGFYGEIYDQARADELLKNQELSPAGRSKISTVTGDALAIAKARTLELGRIRSRWDGYTVVPRPLVQQTTPEPVAAEPKSPADATDAARVAETQAQVDAELEAQDAADAQVARAKAIINFAQAIKQELAELPIEDVIERKRVNDFVERYKDARIPKVEDAKTEEERSTTEKVRGTLAEQIADIEAILRKNIEAIRLEKGAAKYFNQFLPKSMRVRVQYEKAESSEASAKTIEEPLTGERRGAYLGKKNTFLQQYDSLMMLFPNHDAATILHELVHHMVENALMPESIRKVFWEQYAKSALGTKDPAARDYDLMALPDGAQENIANTLLSFIMENKISGATPAMTRAYNTLRAIIQASVVNGKRSLNFIVDDADGSMKQLDGTPLALNDDTKAMLKALIMSPVTSDKLVQIYGDALANSVELGMESGMYDSVVTSERMALLGQQLGMTSENLQKMLATKYGEKVKDPVVLMNIVDAELRDAMPGADVKKVSVRYEARRANRKRGGVLPSVAQGKSVAELGEWAKTAKIVSAAVVGSNGKIYPDVKAKGFKPMGHVQAVMAAAMDGAEPLADGVVTSEGQFASRTMAGAITGHLVGEGWDSSMMARKPDVEIGGEAWQKYLNDAYRRESVGGTPVTVHVRNEIGYHGTQEVRNERVGPPQTDFSGMTRKDLTNRVRQLFADSAGRVDRSAIKALVTSMYGDRSTDKHPTGVSQLSDSEVMALIMAREDAVSQEETEPDLPEYTAELAAAVNEGAVRNLQELADRSMFDKAAGLLARGWRGLISNIADFYTFCNLLACGDENSKWREISDKVRQVNNNEAAERGRVSDALFFELAEAAGQIELDDIIFGTFEVVDGEGRRRLVRNTDAMEAWVLAEGGSNLESVEIQKLLLSNPAKSPNGYDAKMVAAMVGHVNGSAALKKVVAITQKYANAAFEKASGPYYKVTGKTAKMVSGLYSPGEYEGQSYDPGEPSLPFLDNANRGSPLDPTERKEFKHKRRSAGASRNTDYFSKIVKHINALNMYANKAEVINELLAAVESDVMRDAFIDKFGDAALRDKMVQLLLREMAPAGNMRRYSPAERMANDVSRNLVTSALGWNPFSMLTQPVTVGPVMSILGVKSAPRLVANIAKFISEWAGSGLNFVDTDMYKRIKRLSPAVLIESKREPGHERLVTLLEKSGVGALRMHNKVLINMRHIGMKPMAGMDLFVRLATWETAFEQKYEELSRLTGQYTHAQMEERAAAFAEDVILKSHNPTTASEKGLWQTESSALMRSLFAFQSQPFANMKAFLIDGVLPVLQAYQRDGMPGMVRKLASDSTLYRKLMFGAFLPGLALGMLGRRRPQKNLEEVLSDAIWLGLGSMVPVLGGAVWWKSITGFSGSSSFNSLFTQYIDSIANTVGGLTGQRTAMETIPDAIRVIEGLTGIPDYPVKIARKMLEGVIVDGGPHSGRALIDLIKESTGTKQQD